MGFDEGRAAVSGEEAVLAANGMRDEDRGADGLEDGADGGAENGFRGRREVEGAEAVEEGVESWVAAGACLDGGRWVLV